MANDPLYNMGPLVQDVKEAREKFRQEIYFGLGGGMIDLELDADHYELSIDKALERYRIRSSNAEEESFVFLELQPDAVKYKLPNEITTVRQVLRRGGAFSAADPFSQAAINSFLGGMFTGGAGGPGSLVSYEASAQYRKTAAKLFGEHVMFHFDAQSKNITLHRRITATETVCLWVYVYRPDNVLLTDYSSRNWLRRWAIAECKMMLGNARSTYSQLPGAQGGVTLNGDALKTEANDEFIALEEEIMRHRDNPDQGYSFLIG
jgi:hypothetical protein